MDFFEITTSIKPNSTVEVIPNFKCTRVKDLIVKKGKFVAFYDEQTGYWSDDQDLLLDRLDEKLDEAYTNILKDDRFMGLKNNRRTDKFSLARSNYYKYLQDYFKLINDCNANIDINPTIKFLNDEIKRKDYSTGPLDYAKEEGSTEYWDRMLGTLYDPEEQEKIEWMIGSIITGESRNIQKFFVFYGDHGTGKSTVMHLIEHLFPGYWCAFDAARIVSTSEFALDTLRTNPLIAIQHDGDLSRIIDNSKLNSIVSHETMTMNTKGKDPYPFTPRSMLIIGTNSPVNITDEKAGIKRRLIIVEPTGNKLKPKEYDEVYEHIINYERGAVAYKCEQVFKTLGKKYYKDYEPDSMTRLTNALYNFLYDNYFDLVDMDYVTLNMLKRKYKDYVESNYVKRPIEGMLFREELKNFFNEYYRDMHLPDGQFLKDVYIGLKKEKFDDSKKFKKYIESEDSSTADWINFKCNNKDNISKLDLFLQDYPAQYATSDGIPEKRWDNVTTTLKDIDTSKMHYVMGPETLIEIDFDKKNKKGDKDIKLNLAEANKFPRTYAELSKSGQGIHLHYLYSGDSNELSRIFGEDIEIKVFTGKASMRRQLTYFNNEEIAKISDGLPLKEKKGGKMLDQSALQTEQMMRRTIVKCLRNEIHGHHKPNMDFIYKILTDAYNNGVHFDLTDMYNDILNYAMESSSKSDYCLELLAKMPLKSDEPSEAVDDYGEEGKIVFFDVEIWPNLFIFGYKFLGGEKHILLNPKPHEIEFLVSNPQIKLVGFNCRKYDNHTVYAFMNGYNNEQLFKLSQKIIKSEKGNRDAFFAEAYNLSYTDIYDYAKKKQSLKKWEIELGIYHKEMDADWNSPLPEELWDKAKEYNGYDLDATEAVWNATQVDFTSREILADIAGGCVNDTDNMLTARLIFGKERKPQDAFYYRNLAEPVYHLDPDQKEFLNDIFPEMMAETHGEANSLLPYFPGYTYDKFTGKSIYKGEEVGEGGLVRAVPGAYGFSKTFDVTSMHPHSLAAEYLLGIYTKVAYSLVQARVAIKHDDMEFLKTLFDGKLMKYLTDDDQKSKLSTSLKTPINAIYGQTAAKFENKFKDPRNIDNIVAKRGALFMMDLRDAVIAQGYQIFHIKTDSLKVINPDEYIENFILTFGKRYGYSFEVEHEFEKICLVNDAVYIAKVTENDGDWKKACKKAAAKGEPEPTRWTATGAQFQIPYVFKTLFSKEPITFDDVCNTINVSKGTLYLDFNEDLEDVRKYELMLDIFNDAQCKVDIEKKYTKRDRGLMLDFFNDHTVDDLIRLINSGHSRQFIGKVGNFCPIKDGYGGAELVCLNEQGKFVSPSGTKDVRWMESSYVKEHHLEDKIDYNYFEKMCQDAINDISKYDPEFFD